MHVPNIRKQWATFNMMSTRDQVNDTGNSEQCQDPFHLILRWYAGWGFNPQPSILKIAALSFELPACMETGDGSEPPIQRSSSAVFCLNYRSFGRGRRLRSGFLAYEASVTPVHFPAKTAYYEILSGAPGEIRTPNVSKGDPALQASAFSHSATGAQLGGSRES